MSESVKTERKTIKIDLERGDVEATTNLATVNVNCDGAFSHSFELIDELLKFPPSMEDSAPMIKHLPSPKQLVEEYAGLLFMTLFREGTQAYKMLTEEGGPYRIVLETTDKQLDDVHWEYCYGNCGPDSRLEYLIQSHSFVRGIKRNEEEQTTCSTDNNSDEDGVHLIAVPTSPVDEFSLKPAWQRLAETVSGLPHRICLEMVRPATVNNVERIAKFHSPEMSTKVLLLFDHENVKEFAERLAGNIFLVILNPCTTSGEVYQKCNLAKELVCEGVPYVLCMQFQISNEHALRFGSIFVSELLRGVPVEEALLHTRNLLLKEFEESPVFGFPVLYTCLVSQPANGLPCKEGETNIVDNRVPMEMDEIRQADGQFCGRREELNQIGKFLTSGSCAITIVGASGQGKTALAREAGEIYSFAFPDGVCGISLANTRHRAEVVRELAMFLKKHHSVDTYKTNPTELEDNVIEQMKAKKMLLVVDNAETALSSSDDEYNPLGFFRRLLEQEDFQSCILVTSHSVVNVPREQVIPLKGLSNQEGGELFLKIVYGQQYQTRKKEIHMQLKNIAEKISEELGGNPLSIRLLAGISREDLPADVSETEIRLTDILRVLRDKLVSSGHSILESCINFSLHRLQSDVQSLFFKLWVFRGRFEVKALREIVASVGDVDELERHMNTLNDRFLIECHHFKSKDGDTTTVRRFYYLLPSIRGFVESNSSEFKDKKSPVWTKFGRQYSDIAGYLISQMDIDSKTFSIFQFLSPDLDAACDYLDAYDRGVYLSTLGSITARFGQRQKALEFHKRALNILQNFKDASSSCNDLLDSIKEHYYFLGQQEEGDQIYARGYDCESGHIKQEIDNKVSLDDLPIGPLETLKKLPKIFKQMKDEINPLIDAADLNDMKAIFERLEVWGDVFDNLHVNLEQAIGAQDEKLQALLDNRLGYRNFCKLKDGLIAFNKGLRMAHGYGENAVKENAFGDQADLQTFMNRCEGALQHFRDSLHIFHEIGDEKLFANLWDIIGQEDDDGEPPKAPEKKILVIPDVEQQSQYKSMVTDILDDFGAMHLGMNMEEEQGRRKSIDEASAILQTAVSQEIKVDVLMKMSSLYQETRQFDKAREQMETAFTISQDIGNGLIESRVLHGQGLLHMKKNENPQALKKFESAKRKLEGSGLISAIALVDCGLAHLKGKMEKSRDGLTIIKNDVLPNFLSMENLKGQAISYQLMANLNDQIGQKDQVIECYENLIRTYQKMGEKFGRAKALIALTKEYEKQGQPEMALKKCQEALQIFRGIPGKVSEWNLPIRSPEEFRKLYNPTIIRIGRLLQRLGQSEEELFDEAPQHFASLNDKDSEAEIMSMIGGFWNNDGSQIDEDEQETQIIEDESEEANDVPPPSKTENSLDEDESSIQTPLDRIKPQEQPVQYTNKNEETAESSIQTPLNSVKTQEQPVQDTNKNEETAEVSQNANMTEEERSKKIKLLKELQLKYLTASQHKKRAETLDQLALLYRDADDKIKEKQILEIAGQAYLKWGDEPTAIERFEEALKIYDGKGKEVKPRQKRFKEASLLLQIAEFYLKTKEWEKSLENFNELLSIDNESGIWTHINRATINSKVAFINREKDKPVALDPGIGNQGDFGGYQPQSSNFGGYQPQSSNFGGYQPQSSNFGGYQPQSSNIGGVSSYAHLFDGLPTSKSYSGENSDTGKHQEADFDFANLLSEPDLSNSNQNYSESFETGKNEEKIIDIDISKYLSGWKSTSDDEDKFDVSNMQPMPSTQFSGIADIIGETGLDPAGSSSYLPYSSQFGKLSDFSSTDDGFDIQSLLGNQAPQKPGSNPESIDIEDIIGNSNNKEWDHTVEESIPPTQLLDDTNNMEPKYTTYSSTQQNIPDVSKLVNPEVKVDSPQTNDDTSPEPLQKNSYLDLKVEAVVEHEINQVPSQKDGGNQQTESSNQVKLEMPDPAVKEPIPPTQLLDDANNMESKYTPDSSIQQNIPDTPKLVIPEVKVDSPQPNDDTSPEPLQKNSHLDVTVQAEVEYEIIQISSQIDGGNQQTESSNQVKFQKPDPAVTESIPPTQLLDGANNMEPEYTPDSSIQQNIPDTPKLVIPEVKVDPPQSNDDTSPEPLQKNSHLDVTVQAEVEYEIIQISSQIDGGNQQTEISNQSMPSTQLLDDSNNMEPKQTPDSAIQQNDPDAPKLVIPEVKVDPPQKNDDLLQTQDPVHLESSEINANGRPQKRTKSLLRKLRRTVSGILKQISRNDKN